MIRCTLLQKTVLTDDIAAFVLQPLNGRAVAPWDAGAHLDIDLGEVGTRSYSLIKWSNTSANAYHIAVKREADGAGGSAAMHALSEGDEVEISAPKNSFALRDGPEPVALIAGGIGVTPMISMAADLLERDHSFVFHYAGRTASAMAYRDELGDLLGDRLSLHTDDGSPFDLEKTATSLVGHRLYVCGPLPMIEVVQRAATQAGIPSDHVHVELFKEPDAREGDAAFEVQVQSTGDVFNVPAGKTIIEVLEENDLDVLYDCQRGDCGICRVDVIEGLPDHRDVVLSDDERAAGDVMQICVSRALSKRLVLDI
ncbi:PDR/VanB family oxidoreductase [Thalassococcus sp. S3]|uniref:PDR/VanB family oxidoreductase n=1 Tax=Thalassococcus sp. S3 TaxID=2017482 RepID=UPI001023FBC1|nr:PDR/VanB family oxidoreductase [Thalassococcus sp. S3]QBF30497.1 oxidoreductase [Thalassococcus sp. S3]